MGDFTAFLVAIGPLAIMITKGVDFVRSFDKTDSVWKGAWIGLAMVLGVGYALLTKSNYVNLVTDVDPNVVGHLSGTAGQFVTGLAIGAMASFWHEPLSGWGNKAPAPPAE